MSLDVPTAFWKTSNKPDEDNPTISWQLNLYYGSEDIATNGVVGIGTTSKFPFNVDGNDFYAGDFDNLAYSTNTLGIVDGEFNPNAYFGWYLNGSNQYPNGNRSNPWIIEDGGNELNLFFEADLDTVEYLGYDEIFPNYEDQYNRFIQSGYAKGTFSLNSTTNLQIKISGLGEVYNSTSYDTIHLSVDGTHVCRGNAPGSSPESDKQWDMNQVKLFNAAGQQTPSSYVNRVGYDASDPTAKVVEKNRRTYTTTNGQGTFTVSNLTAGNHEIKIYFNTNDGIYNSGAFYGLEFTFS